MAGDDPNHNKLLMSVPSGMSGTATRKMILAHIMEHPGISFNILMSVFRMSEGNLRYHLNMLEKERSVRSKLIKGKKCYFPYDARMLLLIQGGRPRDLNSDEKIVLRLLDHRGTATWNDLLLGTGLSRSRLTNSIRNLKKKEIILTNVRDGQRSYQILTRELLRKRIYRLLLVKLARGEIDEETYLLMEREMIEEL